VIFLAVIISLNAEDVVEKDLIYQELI